MLGDITAKHVYPSKWLSVGCRYRRKEDGILIETKECPDEFHCACMWDVDFREIWHHINYKIVDRNHDTVTGPCAAMSLYEVEVGPKNYEQMITIDGKVIESWQTIELRSIEKEQLLAGARMPPVDAAFRV
jgi:hypothetical protein